LKNRDARGAEEWAGGPGDAHRRKPQREIARSFRGRRRRSHDHVVGRLDNNGRVFLRTEAFLKKRSIAVAAQCDQRRVQEFGELGAGAATGDRRHGYGEDADWR